MPRLFQEFAACIYFYYVYTFWSDSRILNLEHSEYNALSTRDGAHDHCRPIKTDTVSLFASAALVI